MIAVVVVAVVAVIGGRALMMDGEVPYGVTVAGVDVGGLSEAAAATRLREELVPRLNREVIVTLDGQRAALLPTKLNARIDVDATVLRAMSGGRVRAVLLPFLHQRAIEPAVIVPQRPRIPAKLRAVASPPRSAAVQIADDKVIISPAREGTSISPREIVLAAAAAALSNRSTLQLTSGVAEPAITTREARSAAAQALDATGAPITLLADGRPVGALSTQDLRNAIVVRERGGRAEIAFDQTLLAPVIDTALGDAIRDPVNAMWDTNGTRAWVVPARDGVGFQPEKAVEAVRAAATGDGARVADIALSTAPARSTEEAETYGIVERVAGAVTDLGESSASRTHNVALMANILDNRLVMPGDIFSFNDAVGPRSSERGFQEGQAIVGGLMVSSIGGGVCQVSTALYDAVFYMGLEVVERINHSFYISRYGEGMDATVSWDGPDLKFRNDTGHPVLIRATADGGAMIVNLYSAHSERTVEKVVSERHNIVEPQKRYLLDEFAPPGQIIKYTNGQIGFSVDVTRTVTDEGQLISQRVFPSNYVPEHETYIVGPGASLPAGAWAEPPPPGWESPYQTG